MPKAIASDSDKPRRRRGAAVEVERSTSRGLAMRILLYSPKDLVAGAIAFAAVSAIIANALLLQAGRHPSPMFGGSVSTVASVPVSPLPRPRPVEATARPVDFKPFETKSVETRPVEAKPSEAKSVELKSVETKSVETKPVETKSVDQTAHLLKAPGTTAVASTNVMRPPAPIPPSSRNDPVGELITASHRVAAVQRALTEYGYGQLKPTGVAGSDTQVAIQKFERDRKMPVTGQLTDRLVRELSAMTGRPVD